MIYKHYKGGLYLVITEDAKRESDGTREVVYQGLGSGQIYVRPYDEFHQWVNWTDEDNVLHGVKRFEPAGY